MEIRSLEESRLNTENFTKEFLKLQTQKKMIDQEIKDVKDAYKEDGVPVATVAIGKAGAKNAGYLAAQMLAVADAELAEKVRAERQKNAEEVIAKDAALQAQLK